MSRDLLVATKNKKKLEEIKQILKGLKLRIRSLSDYPKVPRIIENGKTFKANAAKKALTIARFTGQLTLGEDSGLCVYALGGRPGVYSSRFAGKGKSDKKNNEKLLCLLGKAPLKRRKAYYACAVALANGNGLISTVEGRCSGAIAYEPKGSFGFGYDPVFIPPKFKKTFAQLEPSIKHSMSHRFRALTKAKRIIQKYIERHQGN
ncbi:MAG: RdgB/HAM1 family non-canonical purine NTP pyrophosphatase [Candidatus Omnitrophota bacterium]|jgi:XTP/dITP diphosphohydrolase|nr:MAG: RdgB/HAM1 family non-canonical purine NTP pyrophosphatase [Candidatus Omnitrophota bacterium]